MLTFSQRVEILAEVGPVFTLALCDATRQRWTYVPQASPDFATLCRSDDGMPIGMLPGWCEHTQRFEFAAYARIAGDLRTATSLNLARPGTPLRIHATMKPNMLAVAADVLRRLVRPYEPAYAKLLDQQPPSDTQDAQQTTTDRIVRLTGATPERTGCDVALSAEAGGVRLPLRVSPGGSIELGCTSISDGQLAAILAGLRNADRLRPSAGFA